MITIKGNDTSLYLGGGALAPETKLPESLIRLDLGGGTLAPETKLPESCALYL